MTGGETLPLWLDGEIVPDDTVSLSVHDLALTYGLGLFETTRTVDGKPWLWRQHLQRLTDSAAIIGMPLTSSCLPSAEQAAAYVTALAAGDVVLRLNASAGAPPLPGRVWMTARPLPAALDSVSLGTCELRVSIADPFARVKCFNYGLRHLAFQWAVAAGFDDVLLVDSDENVLEAAHGNVFLRIDGQWCTPPLTCAVLPGTVRGQVLAKHSKITERVIALADLDRCDAAIFTNSVHGVVPVRRIEDRDLRLDQPWPTFDWNHA